MQPARRTFSKNEFNKVSNIMAAPVSDVAFGFLWYRWIALTDHEETEALYSKSVCIISRLLKWRR